MSVWAGNMPFKDWTDSCGEDTPERDDRECYHEWQFRALSHWMRRYADFMEADGEPGHARNVRAILGDHHVPEGSGNNCTLCGRVRHHHVHIPAPAIEPAIADAEAAE